MNADDRACLVAQRTVIEQLSARLEILQQAFAYALAQGDPDLAVRVDSWLQTAADAVGQPQGSQGERLNMAALRLSDTVACRIGERRREAKALAYTALRDLLDPQRCA